MKRKDLKILQYNQEPDGFINVKPIRVTKVNHAKRLLSRLILGVQTGEIDSQTAKDLTYLLTTFVSVFKRSEFEERIEKLEKANNDRR